MIPQLQDVGPLWGNALGSMVPLVDEAMGPVEGLGLELLLLHEAWKACAASSAGVLPFPSSMLRSQLKRVSLWGLPGILASLLVHISPFYEGVFFFDRCA